MALTSTLNEFDPELGAAMAAEAQRQQDHLGDAAVEKQVADKVVALCRRFPVPA